MSGAFAGVGRVVAIASALAAVLVLLGAGMASAGRYTVVQCGWYVGADADWADSTGGAKFRPDGWCVPTPPADPFDGVHLKSFVREGQGTVSGTRFARWRWVAPAGTGITQVRGTWWHALHDGMEHRIGVGNWSGGFDPFAIARSTDTALRDFVAGFPTPMPALEDRLLCARLESKWCSLQPPSWSGVRALTITIEDPAPPGAAIDGEIVAAGWRRGHVGAAVHGWDVGGGVRFGETLIDGARVALTEYSCAMAAIGGEWRGTRMQPCPGSAPGQQTINTLAFSDGPHSLVHCAVDFSSNVACTPPHTIWIDNNPPAHPRAPTLVGGTGWRRVNDFAVSWENPDQGPASPIGGALFRLVGPAGHDSGAQFVGGRDRRALTGLRVPGPGAYSLRIWLRDEAGNEAPWGAVGVLLLFDDVKPGVAFEVEAGDEPKAGAGSGGGAATGSGAGAGSGAEPKAGAEQPQRLRAVVNDAHSGPVSGAILMRRADSDRWLELITRLQAGEAPGRATLSAEMPELAPGTYLFRADAADAAGNVASSTLRADGTEMAVRRVAPPVKLRARTRLFGRLRSSRAEGEELTVPFAGAAEVDGHLTGADGSGIAGREVQLVAMPLRGAPGPALLATAVSGPGGGFRFQVEPGPSRRLLLAFPGDADLEPSSRAPLRLRVRSAVRLRARPRRLRNGGTVRLSGRVHSHGVPMPRRGKVVAIQYLEAASGRWKPVIVTRSDRHGRFQARYRFRYVSGRARVRLRAVAIAEDRWPYAPGFSRPVLVEVRG